MTDTDPKDMTASELVRWVENYTDIMCRACREMGFGCDDAEVGDCEKALEFIADKIDAELAEARKDAIRESKKPMWWFRNAIKCGYDWPEPRDGEKFRDYLHRCFLPRPRFEDGEPVQSSDMEEIGAFATYRVYMDGSWEFEPDKYEDETSPKLWDVQFGAKSERVKRPATEELGADGMPIKAGETVYPIDSEWIDTPLEVLSVESLSVKVSLPSGKGWTMFRADRLTHTPPDTLERLRDDMYRTAEEWREADSVSIPDMNHWADRLTALIERKGGAE